MFIKKKKIDIDKELTAITEFLEDAASDIPKLLDLCAKMRHYRERDHHAQKKNLPEVGLGFNTQEEVKIWDKVLTLYDFLDEDVEVNKERVKLIAKELLRLGKQRHLDHELIDKMENSIPWKFNW